MTEKKLGFEDLTYDKSQKTIEVEFRNDVRKKLKFDFNAICELEGLIDGNALSINEKTLNFRFIRAALLAGLRWAPSNKKLSLKQIGEWVYPDRLEYYIRVVVLGIQLASGFDPDAPMPEDESEIKSSGGNDTPLEL